MCLSALVFWQVQWHQLHGFDCAQKVCHNRRISQVFQNVAARGKTSIDWFRGFKFHLVVNDRGELLKIMLTAGNTDDRTQFRSYCNNYLAEYSRTKVIFSKARQTTARDRGHSTHYQAQTQHETAIDVAE